MIYGVLFQKKNSEEIEKKNFFEEERVTNLVWDC